MKICAETGNSITNAISGEKTFKLLLTICTANGRAAYNTQTNVAAVTSLMQIGENRTAARLECNCFVNTVWTAVFTQVAGKVPRGRK